MQTPFKLWNKTVLAVAFAIVFILVIKPMTARADGPYVTPSTGNQLATYCLFATGFTPYETVALWLEFSDGSVIAGSPSSEGSANPRGALGQADETLTYGFACVYDLNDGSWVNGQTRLVARGLSSGHEASAYFTYTGQAPTPPAQGIKVVDQHFTPSSTPWFVASGGGMAPYSRVSIWLGQPDGSSIPNPNFSETYANDRGVFYFTVFRESLEWAGRYRVVASDGHHEYYTTFDFYLNDINTYTSPGTTGMTTTPGAGGYQTYFYNKMAGFQPFEDIDVWVGFPTGGIYSQLQSADANGKSYFQWQSFPGEPLGVYTISARGRTSKVQVSSTWTVLDVPMNP